MTTTGTSSCHEGYYVMSVGGMDEAVQSFDMYADEGLQQVRGAAEDPPVPRREVGVGQRRPARLTSRQF
jgi:hypothetical protein